MLEEYRKPGDLNPCCHKVRVRAVLIFTIPITEILTILDSYVFSVVYCVYEKE